MNIIKSILVFFLRRIMKRDNQIMRGSFMETMNQQKNFISHNSNRRCQTHIHVFRIPTTRNLNTMT